MRLVPDPLLLQLLQATRGPFLRRIERVAALGKDSVKLGAERHAMRRE